MSLVKILGDRRLIYLIVFFTIGVPLLRPLGLPLQISIETKSFYDAVEGLKEGDVVYLGIDFLSWSAPELEPMSRAVFKHLLMRPVKIIMAEFASTDGPSWTERIIGTTDLNGKEYGRDIVHLGYYAGGETAIAGFAANIRSIVETDFRGTPIDQLQAMDGVNNARDFALFLHMSSGAYLMMINQIQTPYAARLCAGTSSPEYPAAKPYFGSGQLIGLLNGMRGAAEYEVLIAEPGSASSGMDAQSITQVFVILAIVVGNIEFFIRRSRG